MKNWKLIIFILFVVLVQVSVGTSLRFYNSMLNLPMIFLIIYLIRKDDYGAIWWVALGGLMMDIYSPYFFGYYSFEYLLVFLLYRSAIRPILHDPELPVIAIIYLVINFLIFVIDAMVSKLNPFSTNASVIIYQSFIGLFIYIIYSVISKKAKLLFDI